MAENSHGRNIEALKIKESGQKEEEEEEKKDEKKEEEIEEEIEEKYFCDSKGNKMVLSQSVNRIIKVKKISTYIFFFKFFI